jgi:hypothetical protein
MVWCAGGVLVMNLQPEARSGEFAIVMWHQVSCSCGFVRDGVDVSTTKPGSCWFFDSRNSETRAAGVFPDR